LAQALGTAAVRAGHTVLFVRADTLLKNLSQARADHTVDKAFRRYLGPDLLILDDFGLHRLSAQQSQDLYELVIERHRRASFAITSNRGVDEWLGLFDDPILGNSALDPRAGRQRSAQDRSADRDGVRRTSPYVHDDCCHGWLLRDCPHVVHHGWIGSPPYVVCRTFGVCWPEPEAGHSRNMGSVRAAALFMVQAPTPRGTGPGSDRRDRGCLPSRFARAADTANTFNVCGTPTCDRQALRWLTEPVSRVRRP